MIRYHQQMDADLTAAFVDVPIESASRFGVAKIAEDGSYGGPILDYKEKHADGACYTVKDTQIQHADPSLNTKLSALLRIDLETGAVTELGMTHQGNMTKGLKKSLKLHMFLIICSPHGHNIRSN